MSPCLWTFQNAFREPMVWSNHIFFDVSRDKQTEPLFTDLLAGHVKYINIIYVNMSRLHHLISTTPTPRHHRVLSLLGFQVTCFFLKSSATKQAELQLTHACRHENHFLHWFQKKKQSISPSVIRTQSQSNCIRSLELRWQSWPSRHSQTDQKNNKIGWKTSQKSWNRTVLPKKKYP